MNRCMVSVIAFALLVATAPVSAADGGWSGHGGYSGGGHGDGGHGYNGGGHGYNGGGHGYNGYGYAGHGNYWHGYRGYYAPAYHGYYAPAYYGYAPYYPYYHHNNNNNSAAYLVGGLVVGSLLTNAYIHSQPAYSTQTVVQPTQVVAPAQGRRLLRDLNGDCFERTTDAAGNELRTQLPASECNW